ncbi:MAG: hypothetical protein LBD02_05020 [Christensenellaceae bacterium]|jgi:hypothetical protein|nr:hypothetical protein [Christensenellaceae bacterium]
MNLEALSRAKRIAVLGNTGSGKSFLSKRLHELTGLPLIHLDNEYWGPGWTPRPDWEKRQNELARGESWIIDGNYFRGGEARLARAELFIFLDRLAPLCALAAVGRNGKKRSDLPDYLKEHFGRGFFQGLLFSIFGFWRKGRRRILALKEGLPGAFLRLKGSRAANALLRELEERAAMIKSA